MIPLVQDAVAVGIGAVASAINTVAGGGSLISFPVVNLGFGLPSVRANATNTTAMWPGSVGGGLGYSNLLSRTRHHLVALLIPTLLGSIIGAVLLLSTSSKLFDVLVPPLIFLGASLLAFQKQIRGWAARRNRAISKPIGALLQLLVSVYGGYFGAGMGIMMLAAFSLYVEGDIHEHNAVKNWLGMLINCTASAVFVIRGLVDFHVAIPMVVGSLIGGYWSARISQRIDQDRLRIAIAIYGFGAGTYFVVRLLTKS